MMPAADVLGRHDAIAMSPFCALSRQVLLTRVVFCMMAPAIAMAPSSSMALAVCMLVNFLVIHTQERDCSAHIHWYEAQNNSHARSSDVNALLTCSISAIRLAPSTLSPVSVIGYQPSHLYSFHTENNSELGKSFAWHFHLVSRDPLQRCYMPEAQPAGQLPKVRLSQLKGYEIRKSFPSQIQHYPAKNKAHSSNRLCRPAQIALSDQPIPFR